MSRLGEVEQGCSPKKKISGLFDLAKKSKFKKFVASPIKVLKQNPPETQVATSRKKLAATIQELNAMLKRLNLTCAQARCIYASVFKMGRMSPATLSAACILFGGVLEESGVGPELLGELNMSAVDAYRCHSAVFQTGRMSPASLRFANAYSKQNDSEDTKYREPVVMISPDTVTSVFFTDKFHASDRLEFKTNIGTKLS